MCVTISSTSHRKKKKQIAITNQNLRSESRSSEVSDIQTIIRSILMFAVLHHVVFEIHDSLLESNPRL